MQERMVVKFFIDRLAFTVLQQVHSMRSMQGAVVAPTLVDNADGFVRSQEGYVFPPHATMEEAEPLEQWLRGDHSPDLITCVQVLAPVHPCN
jgi:hypothetical protein